MVHHFNGNSMSIRLALREGGGGGLDLNTATFEELRETGLSVTEVTRILTYRNRSGGFKKLSDLDSIPGVEKSSLTAAKKKLRL
jgi:competence ComEA-like helix-hairpin-helix protein